jgi:hypothetical protein
MWDFSVGAEGQDRRGQGRAQIRGRLERDPFVAVGIDRRQGQVEIGPIPCVGWRSVLKSELESGSLPDQRTLGRSNQGRRGYRSKKRASLQVLVNETQCMPQALCGLFVTTVT